MSHISPFHQQVHLRLIREFGEPTNELGKDHQWTLRPAPMHASIHVLVNGSVDQPAIWVFDPHDYKDGIFRAYIKDMDHLESIIKSIRVRLEASAKATPRKADLS